MCWSSCPSFCAPACSNLAAAAVCRYGLARRLDVQLMRPAADRGTARSVASFSSPSKKQFRGYRGWERPACGCVLQLALETPASRFVGADDSVSVDGLRRLMSPSLAVYWLSLVARFGCGSFVPKTACGCVGNLCRTAYRGRSYIVLPFSAASPYLLNCDGLVELAGKEDPIKLDSSLIL